MSETKTKNLCTVPAADLTDSQYFIAEDGGELKRIPKAQVVLKKLENMLATDTENLAGGGEVTAQELLDALAEQVANKLLAKSQVVNNLLATVEGNPLDATQGKALKDLIDTTNNNLSNFHFYNDISQLGLSTGASIKDILAKMPTKSIGVLYCLSKSITELPFDTQCVVTIFKNGDPFRIEVQDIWSGRTYVAIYSGGTVGKFVEYALKSDLINTKYLSNEFNAYNDTIALTSTATDGSQIQLSTDGTNLYLKKKLKGATDWTMVWKK